MARRVTVSGFISGVDDETFGRDETGKKEFTQETILGDSQPQSVLQTELRWGGECRVELQLTGTLLDDSGVRVTGEAKLFEGVSESTGDLDGTTSFNVLIPRGRTTTTQQRVNNTDEGGDYADISLTFSNALVED